ncbi:toxin secretion/phage lysis holin [Clostridium sp. N3C]|uniref:phage holin family protein n=1 Tax=Clostridium sp. N3C TaxID=1776758 RepID=UPI00092DF2F8|nr:phage holin family protein [Clostridium sp. N3C]SCN25817.1 toxin secretion/phage lysis holin [Clostridium sp. N3C]
MNNLMKLSTDNLQNKIIMGIFLSIISSFKTELIILVLMIILDTLTGTLYAIKMKKFSMKGLKRGLKKILFYSLLVLVIRLVEIGISSLYSTTILTNIITSTLIIIEVTSSLKNLVLLDVPLPKGIADFILKQVSNTPISNLVLSSTHNKDYIEEINDMLNVVLPIIEDKNFRHLLEIKFEEWTSLVNHIDIDFNKIYSNNSEILFFRLSTLISATRLRIRDRWQKEGIPSDCTKTFDDWHEIKFNKWLATLKLACINDTDMDKKKTEIIEKLIIFLYKTITDIKKAEIDKLKGCKTE